jgi:hypothetical protein
MNSYHVTLLYRTRCHCLSWSTTVVAGDIEQAEEIARRRLAKRSPSLTRIDSIETRLIGVLAA